MNQFWVPQVQKGISYHPFCLILFARLLQDRVSLYSPACLPWDPLCRPGWTRTQRSPSSDTWVLGLKVCTITTNLLCLKKKSTICVISSIFHSLINCSVPRLIALNRSNFFYLPPYDTPPYTYLKYFCSFFVTVWQKTVWSWWLLAIT